MANNANNSRIISVFGSNSPQPGTPVYEASRTVGRLLAEAGYAVQTGGYGGVMSGVSQGAKEAGGHVIGITSSQIENFRRIPANQWVIEEIKYPTLRERLHHLVEQCVGCIVMPGGIGTLSELALVWSLVQVGEIPPRPIVLVGDLWQRTITAFFSEADFIRPDHQRLIIVVRTADEAVTRLISELND